MKKIFALLLALTLVFGCMLTLSSCKEDDKGDETEAGQLSGTYVYKNDEYSYELTYEFSGDKITATMKDDDKTMTQKGTYVINEAGDTITFTIVEDGETETFDCDFAEGDGYVMINNDKFIKQ